MKKKFIKLNDNYSHLSIGNLVITIKEQSKNRTSTIQTEVFCTLFNIEFMNPSTVNNYCIGARRIADNHKQIYISLKKKYQTDKTVFLTIVNQILTLINGSIQSINSIEAMNQNEELQKLCSKLYNISKNDFYVNQDFNLKLKQLIQQNLYYECFIEILLFAILEKKQPIYESEKTKYVIETILENTEISALDLQNFLLLELNEGINFSHSIINLANDGNPYANYKLGIMEYNGEYSGIPRFDKGYEYFLKAAKNNHPSAIWMIGHMIMKGEIGSQSENDIKSAVSYFEKAMNLGNVASQNSLGKCYLNGKGIKKDEKKALQLFESAANQNYAFAYNNLGIYYENKDKELSFNYFQKSANLNESFACNKMGEIYRQNNDKVIAYDYYQKALHTTKSGICLWAYYNIGKYYYLEGNLETNILKDIQKAKEYFILSEQLIDSLIELFLIFIEENNHIKILEYKQKIEQHKKYNNEIRKQIEVFIKKKKENIQI